MSPRDEDDKDDLDEFGISGATRTNASQPGKPAKLGNKIVGGESLDWFDPTDILGDLSSLKNSPAFQAALARRISARAPVVQKIQQIPRRNYSLAFGVATIAPHSRLTMHAKAPVRFRGEKIFCTGETDDLLINMLYVGQKLQFPQNVQNIPAVHFAHNALSSGTKLDICEAGMEISVAVENTGSTPRRFGLNIFGTEARTG
jgi:hypothetical protein